MGRPCCVDTEQEDPSLVLSGTYEDVLSDFPSMANLGDDLIPLLVDGFVSSGAEE